MRHRWPVCVEIHKDESISSWLVRCALENGCDPLVLTGNVWKGWRVWTTDIDRGIPTGRLDAITSPSGVKDVRIQLAALDREANKLCPRGPPKHGVWPWVQGLGARNRRYRGGIQYCPFCFAAGSKPYFRRQWRFSWTTGCLIHNVRLIDHCSQCNKPLEPHRIEAVLSTHLARCASCGFDLRISLPETWLPDARKFQSYAAAVVEDGKGEIAKVPLSAHQWFEACRHLVGILRRSSNFPDSIVSKALTDVNVSVSALQPESLNLQLELLPTYAREALLACLEQLLNNLPSFFNRLSELGATTNSIWDRNGRLPTPLQQLSAPLAQIERLRPQSSRSTPDKRRTYTAVLKSWSRLKRKYGIS